MLEIDIVYSQAGSADTLKKIALSYYGSRCSPKEISTKMQEILIQNHDTVDINNSFHGWPTGVTHSLANRSLPSHKAFLLPYDMVKCDASIQKKKQLHSPRVISSRQHLSTVINRSGYSSREMLQKISDAKIPYHHVVAALNLKESIAAHGEFGIMGASVGAASIEQYHKFMFEQTDHFAKKLKKLSAELDTYVKAPKAERAVSRATLAESHADVVNNLNKYIKRADPYAKRDGGSYLFSRKRLIRYARRDPEFDLMNTDEASKIFEIRFKSKCAEMGWDGVCCCA